MIDINNIIKIEGLDLTINDNHILKNISCQLESGKIVVMLGPNGSGKTTFLKTISGLYKKNGGDLIVNGKVETQLGDVAMVFDEPVLYEELTGNEHIKFIYELSHGISKLTDEEIKSLVDVLELNDYMGKLISTYSLGTKKKLQFLCALVNKPKILLMDEYISGLDPQVLYVVKKVMKNYVDNDNFIILSTHMLDMAEKFCDEVMLVKEGCIIGNGVVEIRDILNEYKNLENYYIKMMN